MSISVVLRITGLSTDVFMSLKVKHINEHGHMKVLENEVLKALMDRNLYIAHRRLKQSIDYRNKRKAEAARKLYKPVEKPYRRLMSDGRVVDASNPPRVDMPLEVFCEYALEV